MGGRLEPLAPSPEALTAIRRRHRWMAPLVRAALWPLVSVDVTGREHIPTEGPCLVLTNHVSQLDPILVVLAAARPVQWMASEALLDDDALGRAVVPWGIVPKKKFTADLRAVRELGKWARLGGCAGLFPEGQRPWDGRPLPLLPGIERLARTFGVPVVTGRILNADRQWPRWAAVPRSGRVRVDFDPPVTWGMGDEPSAILGHLRARLHVDPATSPRWPVRGIRLAHGVTNLLFACPRCLAVEALDERGDRVDCRACGAGWRLDGDTLLHPREGGAPEPLATASDRVRAGFEAAGVGDPGRAREGVLLESEPTVLVDPLSGGEFGRGRLRLTPDALALTGTDWRIPLTELSSVSAEQRRRLWIRAGDRVVEPIFPRESTCKWEWVLGHWIERAAAAR